MQFKMVDSNTQEVTELIRPNEKSIIIMYISLFLKLVVMLYGMYCLVKGIKMSNYDVN